MRYCRECGQPHGPTAAFCAHCGAPVRTQAGAPTPPPQPPAPRRRRGLVIGLTAAALVLAGGGTTAVLLTRGDDAAPPRDDSRPVAEQAAGIGNGRSLLSEPGDRWTVAADDLLAGGTVSQVRYDGEAGVSVFAVGDVVVVDATTDDESVLAGLDSATGKTLWTIPGDPYSSSCYPAFAETRLLCNDVEAGAWSVYDAETGQVLKTQQSGYVTAMASSRSTAYLVHSLDDGEGDDFDYDLGVEAIDAATFDTRWSQVLSDEVDTTDDPNAYDGGALVDLDGSQLLVDFDPRAGRSTLATARSPMRSRTTTALSAAATGSSRPTTTSRRSPGPPSPTPSETRS